MSTAATMPTPRPKPRSIDQRTRLTFEEKAAELARFKAWGSLEGHRCVRYVLAHRDDQAGVRDLFEANTGGKCSGVTKLPD